MAGGKDQATVSNVLNATLPTATGGKPAAFTNYATTSAMLMRLDSTLATAAAAGTQLTGTGYTAGGAALGQSTASSSGSAVTLPAATTSWTNGSGSAWNIDSLDITDATPTRTWWGPWNGEPISVANGNTFQVAANAVSVSDA
ncbi:MAG TPA: hypothetical protein VKU39_05230 [Streptosporangiaceae bacterium]|nr:hypothetical protein [Streptosporangiaceae bacterium]